MNYSQILTNASCEGCGLRLTILRRKRKCSDCGFVFCSDCAIINGRFPQCYRCRILNCSPLDSSQVAQLKLRDLQWYLESRGVFIPSHDQREKPVLVDRVLEYSRRRIQASRVPVPPPIGGLFQNPPPTQDIPLPPQIFSAEPKTPDIDITKKYNHPLLDVGDVTRSGIVALSARELKVLLTRNFVSFRGCCEKEELVERAQWLWDRASLEKGSAVSDENLCKICMECAVDSVLLECGHMVTCTGCGKYLHDCPICRQTIARVVRAFRA